VSALTSAAKGDWHRIVNSGIVPVAFLTDARDDWGLSRFGIHCLEAFFRFIRRNAFHDDRPETAESIIFQTSTIAEILHTCDIAVVHQNRSNLGGVTIGPGEVDYERAEITADVLLECANHITDFDIFSDTDAEKKC
jgi:hypothetical protein